MKKNVVWLASYPKSGNTWMRIFLANYVINAKEPVPINEVRRFGTGDSILHHYNRIAKKPIDASNIELTLKLRTPFLHAIVANNADVNIVKNANIRAHIMGVELIPEAITRSAVYVMRNPLDMVLSYARHFNMDIEVAAKAIGHGNNGTLPDARTVTQFLGTWSEHVRSWTSALPYPQLTLRYEDMLADPDRAFRRLIEHLGMPVEDDRLARAIDFSGFEEVSRQESEVGFGEKALHSDKFFGRGTSGHWRDELDDDLVKMIKRDHKAMMKKHGYWND